MEELKADSAAAGQLPSLKRPVAAIAFVMIVAAVLRLAFVSADLPLFVSRAQDDVYNGAWYVQDAQYIVQGRQPLYDEGAFKLLWTGYFTAVFYLLGPGPWQGNAGAALLGVACVWLIFAVVRRAAGTGTALVALLVSAANFILIVYSRTALPYIGVCAAAMLCLYLWYILHSRPWLLFIPYLLPVVFAFHLKSIAGLVLPVMAITDIVMLLRGGRAKLLVRARPYLAGAVVACALLLVEYFALRGAAGSYVQSRLSAYVGEVSLMDTVRGWLSVGFETGYFTQMPVVAFLALLYPVILARRWRERTQGELRLGIACTVWIAGALAAFGFLKYRSLHYFIVMSPPMLILAALCVRELALTKRLGGGRRNVPALVLGFLLIAYLSYQAFAAVTVAVARSGEAGQFLRKSVGVNIHSQVVMLSRFGASWVLPLSLVVAFALVGIWRLARKKLPDGAITLPPGLAGRTAAVVLALSVLLNLAFFVRFAIQRDYSVTHIPREIQALVGENTVISEHGCSLAGYGNLLTTERTGFNFQTGSTGAKNVTHLFLNYYRARKIRPNPLGDGPYARPVAVLTAKKIRVILYRLKELPPGYRMSLYEEGEEFLRQDKYEQALRNFMAGIEQFPESGVLRRSAGVALYRAGRIEEAEAELREALELLPEDFITNAYLTACLTVAGRYREALEHLEWMRDYYELDLMLKKLTFDYRDCVERARTINSQALLRLLEPILEI